MKANPEIVLRQVAGENLLVPFGETAARFQGMISLNASGKLLWERLRTECTREDLVQLLLEVYDVEAATAQKDVDEFLARIRSQDYLLEQ